MPLPGSDREKRFLDEVNKKKAVNVGETVSGDVPAVFLQEIKEPTHEEVIVEQPKKRRRSKKK